VILYLCAYTRINAKSLPVDWETNKKPIVITTPKEIICRTQIQDLIVDVYISAMSILVMPAEKALKLHRKSFFK
jgi:hypothetical protein